MSSPNASLQEAQDEWERIALQKNLKNLRPVHVKYRDGSTYALSKWKRKIPMGQDVHLEDLRVERKLGQGGFGIVYVSLAFENTIFALACIMASLAS